MALVRSDQSAHGDAGQDGGRPSDLLRGRRSGTEDHPTGNSDVQLPGVRVLTLLAADGNRATIRSAEPSSALNRSVPSGSRVRSPAANAAIRLMAPANSTSSIRRANTAAAFSSGVGAPPP